MSPTIEERVAALVQALPPLDESVERLMRDAVERRSDRPALERLVSGDSGLCSDLLSLANCVCLDPGAHGPVQTVREALDRVDSSALATLVGASWALRAAQVGLAPARKQWDELVEHSRDIAAACAALGEVIRLPTPTRELHTVAGLTHDVGRIVMLVAARNESASLLGTSPEELARIVADERAAYGMDHCRIGFELFRKWDFSGLMQEGILRHHSPLIREDFSFPGGLIFVGHFVTMSDFTGSIIARMLPAELLRRLGLTAADLDRARGLYPCYRSG